MNDEKLFAVEITIRGIVLSSDEIQACKTLLKSALAKVPYAPVLSCEVSMRTGETTTEPITITSEGMKPPGRLLNDAVTTEIIEGILDE